MTTPEVGVEPSAEPAAVVGFGKPPTGSRFKAGVSGNPKGRPRKQRPAEVKARPTLDDLLMEELHRPVPIIENNQTITLPVFQVILRQLFVSAIKGDRRAALAAAQMMAAQEKRTSDKKQAAVQLVAEYKRSCESELSSCNQDGIATPEPLPHPDDMSTGPRGDVVVNGPANKVEKARWDAGRSARDDAQREILHLKAEREQAENKTSYDNLIQAEQDTIDFVDRTYPTESERRTSDFHLAEWRDRQARDQKARGAKWRSAQNDRTRN